MTFRRRPARRRPARRRPARRSPPGVVLVAGSSPRSRSRCRTTRLFSSRRSVLSCAFCSPARASLLGRTRSRCAPRRLLTRSRANSLTPRTLRPRRLTRSSQIGEFYIMQPPQVEPQQRQVHLRHAAVRRGERPPRARHLAGRAQGQRRGRIIAAKGRRRHGRRGARGPAGRQLPLLPGGSPRSSGAAYSADQTLYTDANGKISTVAPSSGAPTALPTISSAARSNRAASDRATMRASSTSPASTAARRRAPLQARRRPFPLARPCAALTHSSARVAVEHLMHSVILTVSGRETGATCAILPRTPICDCCRSGCLPARSVRPGGHAALGKHTGEDHRGTLYRAFQSSHYEAAGAPPPIRTFSMLALTRPTRNGRRARHARRGVQRLCHGLQHDVVSRRPRPASQPRRGRDEHHEAAVVCRRRGRALRQHARVPGLRRSQFRSATSTPCMCAAAVALALSLTRGLLRSRSITTRLLPWEVTSATGGDHNSFPGGEKLFAIYSQMLNLRCFGEDMKARSRPRLVLRAPFVTSRLPLAGRREHGVHLAGYNTRAHTQRVRLSRAHTRVFVSQARRTTRCASSGRTAATTRLPRASTRSSPDRATCAAAAAAAHPPPPPLAAHRRCARSAVWSGRHSRRCTVATG